MVHKLKTIRGDMLVLQCQLERELIRYVRRYLCQPQVTIITNDNEKKDLYCVDDGVYRPARRQQLFHY